MAGKNVIELTDENFDTEVTNSQIPVLVDFTATWCGPCKQLAPIVEKIADEVGGYGIRCDVGEPASVEAAFMAAGPVDILINNAGINNPSSFESIDHDEFLRIQQVNVFAPMALCQAAIPSMLSSGWGRIVNISSAWSKKGKEQRAPYSSSKFAIDGLTLSLAIEYAKSGILANCVAPGFVDTEMTRRILGDAGIEKILQNVPIGRLAQPAEIAEVVLWLSSPQNTYITGQNIAVDGGFTRA